MPQWAHAAAGGAVVVPSTGKAASGYGIRERVPAGWLNYHLNLFGQWVGHLAGPSLTSWSRHDFPTPDTGYSITPRAAVDVFSADDEETRYRYAVATEDGIGPCVLVSRRGQAWVLRRNLGGLTGTPQGILCTKTTWIVWSSTETRYALLDDPSRPDSGPGASQLRDDAQPWTVSGSTTGVSIGDIAWCTSDVYATGIAVASADTGILVSFTGGAGFGAPIVVAGRETGRAVAVAPGTYVELSSNAGNGYIVRSTDTVSWAHVHTITGTTGGTMWKLVLGPSAPGANTFIAFKREQANPHLHVSTDDGVTWVPVAADAALTNVTSITYRDGVWVATLFTAPYALTSSDLERWIPVPIPVPETISDARLHAAVFGGGAWLLAGETGVLRGAPGVDPGPEGYVPGTPAAPLTDASRLRGRRISTAAPGNRYALLWNAGTGQWEPSALVEAQVRLAGTYKGSASARTRFAGAGVSDAGFDVDVGAPLSLPGAGRTLSTLRVRVIANTLALSCDLRVYVNGVATALTVVVAAGATGNFADTVATVPVVDGSRIELVVEPYMGTPGAGEDLTFSASVALQ